MSERRSLGAALEMTPEKRAFIQSGTSTVQTPKERTEAQRSDEALALAETAVVEREQKERPTRRARSRRQMRAPLASGDEALLGIANLLVPLTTRLQPTTAAALKRAGLEQKLRGQTPSTVQEIAEEAIQDWLRDYGFLD